MAVVDKHNDVDGLTPGMVQVIKVYVVRRAAPINIYNPIVHTRHRCDHLWGEMVEETKMRLEAVVRKMERRAKARAKPAAKEKASMKVALRKLPKRLLLLLT
jgi:hypothetical protein